MELNRQETDKWNTEIEKIVGIGLTMLQRAELSNYFKSEVKKLTLTDVGFTLPRPLEAWNEAQKLDVTDYIDWHLEKEKSGN
jgi:hypothetical protein